jgi:hypothetical protein
VTVVKGRGGHGADPLRQPAAAEKGREGVVVEAAALRAEGKGVSRGGRLASRIGYGQMAHQGVKGIETAEEEVNSGRTMICQANARA